MDYKVDSDMALIRLNRDIQEDSESLESVYLLSGGTLVSGDWIQMVVGQVPEVRQVQESENFQVLVALVCAVVAGQV